MLNTDIIYASFAIILRSHAIANAAPIPAAAPLIEPITGLGISIIFFKKGLYPLTKASLVSFHEVSLSVKSAPAEKPLPAPVITNALI